MIMDDLLTLLNQALGQRSSIWMFYTIIVTTAIGTAFTDNYKKLKALPRVFLSVAVGTAVWYNFYSAIINSVYIHELVSLIKETVSEDDPLKQIFFDARFYNQEEQIMTAIFYIYIPINVAVFVAMWWDELVSLDKWVRKKVSPVKNDFDF